MCYESRSRGPSKGTKGTSKGVEVVRVKSNHTCAKMSK